MYEDEHEAFTHARTQGGEYSQLGKPFELINMGEFACRCAHRLSSSPVPEVSSSDVIPDRF